MAGQKKPIHSLSTELIALIAKCLGMKDLRNLRLASSWLQDQTRADFLRRGFSQLHINHRTRQVAKMVAVLHNRGVAESIQHLTLFCVVEDPNVPLRYRRQRYASDDVATGFWMADLLTRVPNLVSLRLGEATCCDVFQHLPTNHLFETATPLLSNIQTLTLVGTVTESTKIVRFIEAFAPQLETFAMWSVRLLDYDWVEIFRQLQALPLRRLVVLEGMWTRDCHDKRHNTISLTDGRRVQKTFRGDKGIETIWLTKTEGRMHGKQAVQQGIEAILKWIAKCKDTI